MPFAPRAGLAAVVLTLTGAARPSPALRHVTIEAHDDSYVVPAMAPAERRCSISWTAVMFRTRFNSFASTPTSAIRRRAPITAEVDNARARV